MDNLNLVQGAYPSLATGPRTTQNLPPRTPQSSIMAKWEHDHFGMNTNPRVGSTISKGVEQQERSTVSSWRDFAQSHTSKPLPPLRGQNAGDTCEDVWRKGTRRAGGGNEGAGPRAAESTLPTLPAKPTLPVAPILGQNHIASRGPSQPALPPQIHLTTPALSPAIPQDRALHKRKSEEYFGQNRDITTEEPHSKRASPNRPSSLSAAFARNNGAARAGPLSLPRRTIFEQWVSSRSRPRMVAPNGTTIIPSQPRLVNSQQPPRSYPAPEDPTQIRTPDNQPRTSSPNPTPPISRPHSPSFPLKTTPSTIPSTPAASSALSPASSPLKSRGKTTDDMARRMIFAGIGAGRVPKRTEEELKKRQEEQERRRVQREEREELGKEEMMKWSGTRVVKTETKPAAQVTGKEDLIKPTTTRSSVTELTHINGENIQW
ncbi:hypothetical protein IFR05_007301 [Cadophora sp. M221]|nr:hypothetical protein IFR05_007301 [Cadophora sp. M221]